MREDEDLCQLDLYAEEEERKAREAKLKPAMIALRKQVDAFLMSQAQNSDALREVSDFITRSNGTEGPLSFYSVTQANGAQITVRLIVESAS